MPRPHRVPIEVVPFANDHVGAAARLVAARFGSEITANPLLPAAQADPGTHQAILEALARDGSGVAAIRSGELVGFQAAWLVDGRNGRWSYSPDAGHATTGDDGRLAETLYAHLAEGWLASACREHVVVVLAHDTATFDAFVQLGFGMLVVDLVRNLDPVSVAGDAAIEIRRASVADAGRIRGLEDGLREHLAASPVFQPSPPRPLAEHEQRLADPARPTFLAEDASGTPIAYLRIGPCATDVAMIVRDPLTASITGAFTVADRRGEDVATALLDRAVTWARDHGFARCAVDHESANLEASRFWSRHFVPAAYSLVRRIFVPVEPA